MKQKQNRVAPLIASVAIQLCLGIAYVWSVFQTGIANTLFNGNNAAAGLTFSMLLATLGIGGLIGGKLAAKYSTRIVVILGGVILSIGFFLASFVTPSMPWLLWITYGIMGGTGMGFTYSTTIACVQKWYPDKKGLVTGIIVSALGLGGVVFTPVIESLITYFGGAEVGELDTFRVLSGIFLVVCTIGALFLKNPPKNEADDTSTSNRASSPEKQDYLPSQVVRMPEFYMITFTLMLACMGGLMMIGFAKPIAIAKGLAETATIGVLIVSICNAFGRLLWGFVSDKIGRLFTIIILLAGSATASLLTNAAEGYYLFVIIGLIAFLYGGFLSTFPALTGDLFGAKHMATNYGMVLIGFGAGAIASSFIAGYYKNIASQDISLMFPAFIISAVCSAIGIALIIILNIRIKSKERSSNKELKNEA